MKTKTSITLCIALLASIVYLGCPTELVEATQYAFEKISQGKSTEISGVASVNTGPGKVGIEGKVNVDGVSTEYSGEVNINTEPDRTSIDGAITVESHTIRYKASIRTTALSGLITAINNIGDTIIKEVHTQNVPANTVDNVAVADTATPFSEVLKEQTTALPASYINSKSFDPTTFAEVSEHFDMSKFNVATIDNTEIHPTELHKALVILSIASKEIEERFRNNQNNYNNKIIGIIVYNIIKADDTKLQTLISNLKSVLNTYNNDDNSFSTLTEALNTVSPTSTNIDYAGLTNYLAAFSDDNKNDFVSKTITALLVLAKAKTQEAPPSQQ